MATLKLHDYQKHAIEFIHRKASAFVMAEVGTGKTLITLKALELLPENSSILIVAPLAVIKQQTWEKEASKWGINVKFDAVSETQIKKIDKFYDVVVIDEIHSFKSHTTKKYKQLKRLTSHANKVIGLTGTPNPNSYMDLFAQFLLLNNVSLGRNLSEFRGRWCYPIQHFKFIDWKFDMRKEQEFLKTIRQNSIQIRNDNVRPDSQDLFYTIQLPKRSRRIYDNLRQQTPVSDEELIEIAIASSVNKAILQNKLIQIANGGLYTYENDERITNQLHKTKITKLKQILKQHDSALIVFNYIFEKEYLQKIPGLTIYDRQHAEQQLADFNAGKIKYLAVNPKSLSVGVNLQQASDTVIWLSLTFSLQDYIQTTARIIRQGNTNCKCIHIIAENTLDEHILDVLNRKKQQMSKLFEEAEV